MWQERNNEILFIRGVFLRDAHEEIKIEEKIKTTYQKKIVADDNCCICGNKSNTEIFIPEHIIKNPDKTYSFVRPVYVELINSPKFCDFKCASEHIKKYKFICDRITKYENLMFFKSRFATDEKYKYFDSR
jgi:hypothetical protein